MTTDSPEGAPIAAADVPNAVPVLPLRDVVVYPHMVIPLFVGREKSILALDQAMKGDKQILLIAQKAADVDDPKADDLYRVGTLATILQLLKLPDGTVKVLVEGVARARVDSLLAAEFFAAQLVPMLDIDVYDEREIDVLTRSVVSQFEQYVKMNKKVPPEVLTSLAGIEQAGRLADTVAAHMALKLAEKQKVLEIADIRQRLEHVLAQIEGEMEVLQIEKRIRGRVKQQMEKSQREYYLNEQMKAIQRELGEIEDAPNELGEIEKRIKKAGMPKDVRDKAMAELNKLKLMSPMSAEATVVRNYVDWLVKAPWKKRSKVRTDITAAQTVLDEDHFGLDKVKERIVEFLAVQQRVQTLKGPILCLVGPPGVGKTSLGQSIAKATNRKFVRMSLGGVRDEAEIRGHRRTYIGSMPGKILQNMVRTGVRNPLFLLDEVDKMSMDFRGDPSAALLEVLDPEQNDAFVDHYIDLDYDLSKVLFITTANNLGAIPWALQDRLEIIELGGYTEQDKRHIGRKYLVPRQIAENGLKDVDVQFTDDALAALITGYTREAGVRNLERQIGAVCRKVATEHLKAKDEKKSWAIDAAEVKRLLGVERFRTQDSEKADRIGVTNGLAVTSVGGDLLLVEVALVPGKGRMTLTGKLGDVMKESVEAAMSYVRSRAHQLGLGKEFYQKVDLHVHFPEGAIPKDGPSAGIAITTALVSALTQLPVRHDVAMTGEITLRGRVLPIGGLKEKVIAAHRAGVKRVLFPKENERDVDEIPQDVRDAIELIPVEHADQVLRQALRLEDAATFLIEPAGYSRDYLGIFEEVAETVAH